MSEPMGRMLVIVDAPHFYAMVVIGRKTPTSTVIVLEAAPILRWLLGKPWITVRGYFERKGWAYTLRPDPAQASQSVRTHPTVRKEPG